MEATIERGYSIDSEFRIPASSVRFEASSDVRGGGTGGEFVSNLSKEGSQDWNKWYTGGGNSGWVVQHIDNSQTEYYITKYAFCSANDCPHRDPVSWSVRGSEFESNA